MLDRDGVAWFCILYFQVVVFVVGGKQSRLSEKKSQADLSRTVSRLSPPFRVVAK